MSIINIEKIALFQDHAAFIRRMPELSAVEIEWIEWAEKRIAELEATK